MSKLVEGVDYVECKLCKFASVRISQHVKKIHGMNRVEYEKLYGTTSSSITHDRFVTNGKVNGNWIERKKAAGDDLADYRAKMGKAVTEAIMSNDSERDRRSKLMAALNKRDDARERSSIAAKKTSARPEILAARSRQLSDWRKREPDSFYNKCTSKMIGFRTSKPEKWMLTWAQQEFLEFDFKGNQRLKSVDYFHLTTSQKRQLDILSKKCKVIIEIDGILHFKNIPSWNQLEEVKAKDHELNIGAVQLGYTLIRISYDQWNQHTGEVCKECLDKVRSVIVERRSGVHLFGENYAENQVSII